MKAAINTLYSISKGANTSAKDTARAHRDKNDQCLLSSRSGLTSSSISFLHSYCQTHMSSNPIASLILIMIYAGRNCYDVVDNLELVTDSEGEKQLRLWTRWEMPTSRNTTSGDTRIKSLASNMYLILPLKLLPATKLSGYLEYRKKLESWVQDFLPQNAALPSERFTLSRVKLVLSHYAAFADISDYEHAFISARKFEDESHQSYGTIDRNLVQFKFDVFREAVDRNDLYPQHAVFAGTEYQPLGSNFASDAATISNYFHNITREAVTFPTRYEDRFLNFNILTEFIVAYLSLCTLYRPRYSPFGTLKYFDLHAGIVSILDKGAVSFRQIPLCKSALTLIVRYISFLKDFAKKFENRYPKVSTSIGFALNGDSPIFQKLCIRSKSFKPLKADFMHKYTSSMWLKNNYERHYMSTFLVKEGHSRNDVKILLGHKSASNRSERFNSSDYNLLHSVVDKIERHILSPIDEGDLGIQIPSYLYDC
jgi:hypothetical protein